MHHALMQGTGADQVHLLVVCTAERGLCGGFNSSIAKIARERTKNLLADGKTVKILCVGKKGADAMKRDLSSYFIDKIEFRGVKAIHYDHADGVGKKSA